MRALVVYHSRKGTTRKFAEKLYNKNVEVITKDIEEATDEDIVNCDIVYMGSWTNGRFLLNQKPAHFWVNFAEQLPLADNKKTVLFTTYNIRTGTMFRNMKKYITSRGYKVIGSMKSRNGKLDYYSDVILRYSLN